MFCLSTASLKNIRILVSSLTKTDMQPTKLQMSISILFKNSLSAPTKLAKANILIKYFFTLGDWGTDIDMPE